MPDDTLEYEFDTLFEGELPTANESAFIVVKDMRGKWQILRLVFGDDNILLGKFNRFHGIIYLSTAS